MKTFATENKPNYSVTDKEPESGYNLLFFRFLFDSFFKSNKSTVDFGQYDKMKVFIIEKENDVFFFVFFFFLSQNVFKK